MKKLSVALLAAASFVSATAVNASDASAGKNGLYAGLSAGIANSNLKYNWKNSNANKTAINAVNIQNFNVDTGKAAGLFGGFVGFGQLINGIYVGGELFGGLDTTKFSPYDDSKSGTDVGLFKAKVERKAFYGFAFHVGGMVNPITLVYLRVGAEYSKWKLTSKFNANAVDAVAVPGSNDADNAILKKEFTKNKGKVNFAPGVGIRVCLNKEISVGAEYSCAVGVKLDGVQDKKTATANLVISGDQVEHKLSGAQHRFSVRVIYKF